MFEAWSASAQYDPPYFATTEDQKLSAMVVLKYRKYTREVQRYRRPVYPRLATKERIDTVAAPTAVADAQVALDKEEEDVVAAATAAEEHTDTAAGAVVVGTPSRGCRATTNELAAPSGAPYLLLLFWISCA